MQRSRRQVERPGVQQQEAAFPRRNRRQLREADIIANGHGDLAIRRNIHKRELVPWGENVGLAEGDLARDIYVKQMHLPVCRQQFSLRGEEQRRVVIFLAFGHELGNAAAENIGVCFGGEGRERVKGGRLRLGWRRREQDFCVGGEVLATVGGVEAFGEDDQRRAGAGGFDYFGASAGEVDGFVGALGGQLNRVLNVVWVLPAASCTRASFKGFLRRPAIAVTARGIDELRFAALT